MKPIVPISILLTFMVYVCSSSVWASTDSEDRQTKIDEELNCVSNHVQSGVEWSDVCYTSSTPQSGDRDQLIAKSMDQMIEEHNAAAEEWSGNRTNDSISEEHNQHQYDATSETRETYVESNVSTEDTYQDSNPRQDYQPQQDQYARNDSPKTYKSTENTRRYDRRPASEPLPRKYKEDWWYDDEGVEERPENFHKRTHEFNAGTEVFYYKYREPGVMKMTGIWKGFFGGYTYRPEPGDVFHNPIVNVFTVEGRYAYGNVEYNGGGVGGGVFYPFKIDDIRGRMYEARLLFGKDYYTTEISRITPYVGFGMRQKADKMGGRTVIANGFDFHGYDRTATYYYLPVGFHGELQDQSKNGVDVIGNVEYDVFIKGQTKSHNTDIDEFRPYHSEDFVHRQKKGFGVRTSIKVLKHFSAMDIYAEPFIRYWHLQNSEVVNDFIEPNNNTIETGSKFGINF